jgi:hypothetical protein
MQLCAIWNIYFGYKEHFERFYPWDVPPEQCPSNIFANGCKNISHIRFAENWKELQKEIQTDNDRFILRFRVGFRFNFTDKLIVTNIVPSLLKFRRDMLGCNLQHCRNYFASHSSINRAWNKTVLFLK